MEFKEIGLILVFILSVVSCNDTTRKEETVVVPAETRSTMEYNQNQLDTIPKTLDNKEVFRGNGGEPFWSIEINSESILFVDPNSKIVAPIVEPIIKGDSFIYISKFENGTLKATISKETCTDGMSGKRYSHKVELEIDTNKENESQTYSGCGSYQASEIN